MPLPGLEQFMDALGQLESGNNYGAVGPTHPTMGRALGRFQIMETNWSAWASEAGIPGADWRDPRAQDRVASYKMARYYQQFGSWDLVAVAWFAGPGRAAKAKAQGLDSVGQLKDSLGTSVSKYVAIVMDTMGDAGRGGTPVPTTEREKLAQVITSDPAAGNHDVVFDPTSGEVTPTDDTRFGGIDSALSAAFRAISTRIAGGERIDHRTLTAPVDADRMERPDPGRNPGQDFEPRTA